jgi:hypothetical protein
MAALARGRGHIDWTGLALGVSEEAGIKIEWRVTQGRVH